MTLIGDLINAFFVYKKSSMSGVDVICMNVLDTGTTNPGAKKKLKHAGMLVQRNTFGIEVIDNGWWKDIAMKSGKTVGGIKNFASRLKTVQK